MPNVLITPTILDSFEFAKNAPKNWKVRAHNDLVAKLRREKTEMPDWVKKGSAFEDTVYRVCRGMRSREDNKLGSEKFKKVTAKCYGGTFQERLSKYIEVDGIEVCLYCVLDVLFADKIIDIKTTLKWKGDYKYLKGWQHRIYTLVADIAHFEYLIVKWQNEHSDKIDRIYNVPYKLANKTLIEEELISSIEVFFNWLKEHDLWKDYYTIFSNNR